MRKGPTLIFVLAGLLLAIPSSALGKGIIEVAVEADDGTARTFAGDSDLDDLVQSTHVFSAVFHTDPAILMAGPPSGDLGPRFSLLWDLGFPQPVRQDAYPLAETGPATFVPAGQQLEGDPESPLSSTVGGWFRADAQLGAALDSLGFAVEEGRAGGIKSGILLSLGVVALVLLVATAVLARARRRPLPA